MRRVLQNVPTARTESSPYSWESWSNLTKVTCISRGWVTDLTGDAGETPLENKIGWVRGAAGFRFKRYLVNERKTETWPRRRLVERKHERAGGKKKKVVSEKPYSGQGGKPGRGGEKKRKRGKAEKQRIGKWQLALAGPRGWLGGLEKRNQHENFIGGAEKFRAPKRSPSKSAANNKKKRTSSGTPR